MGTKFALVVDEVVSKQLFRAHTAELLEAGDYKLVVKSRAGDAEGPLQTATKRVKYLKVIDPPTVDDVASEGHTGEIVSGTAFAAKGSGLDAFDAEAGDTVKVKWTQGGEDKEALIDPADIAADKLSFEFPDALVGVPADTELTFEFTFGSVVKSASATMKPAPLPKVTIDDIKAATTGYTYPMVLVKVGNVEAAEDGNPDSVTAHVSVNGEAESELTLQKTDDWFGVEWPDLEVGDTVKVTVKVDPSKIGEYDPTPAVATTIAE